MLTRRTMVLRCLKSLNIGFSIQLIVVFFCSLLCTIATLNIALQHGKWNVVVDPQITSVIKLESAINLAAVAPTNSSFAQEKMIHLQQQLQQQRQQQHHDHVHFSDYNQELARLNSLIDRLHPPLNRSRPVKLNRKARACSHETIPERFPTHTSSMEFVGCCGLGHRLARHATVAHLSHALRMPLYGWWGCCQEKRVFSELFGSAAFELTEPFQRPVNDQQHYQFRFDVVGPVFGQFRVAKHKNGIDCPARPSKVESDYKFYSMLRDRYTRRDEVEAFVKEHFSGKFAIGVHLRAGNGETGDFRKKARQVFNKESFLKVVKIHIRNITNMAVNKEPVVFLATDTPSYVTDLREALKGRVTVVDAPQVRMPEGGGVFFGEMKFVKTEGENCMDGWHGAMMDALILSHADVVYAPKPSAFTETLPLSLVTGSPNRTVNTPFCESKNWRLKCFESVEQWSCETLSAKPTFFDALPPYEFL